MSLYIGLMSGTSMDGIDAALVDVTTHQLIAGTTRPYTNKARQALKTVLSKKEHTFASISELTTLLGREFAAAALDVLSLSHVNAKEVVAIGSHGQTIAHDALAATPYTVQLGCPHTISELTKRTVVADFRTRDLVIGGMGAPYAPIYHQALFAKLNETLAIVNIGGIANITCLAPNGEARGYDIGPGNCLMDWWIQKNLSKSYDEHGHWALSGKPIQSLLSKLLDEPYFQLLPPKSIGKEYFLEAWLLKHMDPLFSPADVQATLLAITASTIADAIKQHQTQFDRVLICGGGAHNQALLTAIQSQLQGVKVDTTQSLNISPDYLEAMMFAWLAHKTLTSTPLDLRQITGAKNPTVLGAIYPYGEFK